MALRVGSLVRSKWLFVAVGCAGLTVVASGQRVGQAPPAAPAQGRGAQAPAGPTIGQAARTNPPEVLAKDATGDAATVLALAQKVEEATVSGDVAAADNALSSDFSMVHGDQWTRGLPPLASDDKAGYITRVKERQYLVHDTAETKLELHGDVIITYGRYVSLYAPPGRTATTPPRLTSIWFERVYAKRDGRWQYLSHRTVHGPDQSPAGIDPTRINTPEDVKSYVLAQPPADIAAKTYPPANAAAAEVLAADSKINQVVLAGDRAYWDANTPKDFRMTHGDIWTRGGPPALVDTQETFGDRVTKKQYLAMASDSVQVEMHGDVAITYGRYIATLDGSAARQPDKQWFSVWFERVWQKRGGKWIFLSYRTVHGATYGPTRESVANT